MDKLQLDIIGMSYSQSQSGAYALILGETDGKRRLPIIIGGFEAQAIAIELENMKPSRPLTHDLFKNFAETFNIMLEQVIINKFYEGVFYAQLICINGKERVEIDARTSDAVALAIRFKCPIYTYEEIMSEAGIVMDEKAAEDSMEDTPEEKSRPPKPSEYEHMSIDDLKEQLQKAVEKENYEKASLIRDEINKKKKKK